MTPRRRKITETSTATKSLNTKSTGDILRSAREARGESLAQVSQSIKVRVSMLQAIEDGQFFGLTDPLYLKGFIRAYARHLGLQESEVMPFFRREYDQQQQQQLLAKPLAPIEPKKSIITPGRAVVAILAMAVMVVAGYSYNQYVSVALTPLLEVTSPKDSSTTDSGQVEVAGVTDPDAQLTLNGQPVTITPSGEFTLEVALANGANLLQFKAVNKIGKITTVERTVIGPPRQSQAAQSSPTPTVLASSSANAANSATKSASLDQVKIEVVIGPSPVWLDIKTDNNSEYAGLILPGASRSFTAKEVIHLKTGNAGSTKVLLQGVDQGLLGQDNQVVEKTYKK